MEIVEGVIVHRAAKVDGVQNFQLIVTLLHQRTAYLLHDSPFRIGADIGGIHLKQIGLDVVAGFSAAAASDHQDVEIDIPLFRIGNLSKGQPLRIGQQDILGEIGVDERRYIFFVAPSGRAVFFSMPILFRILDLRPDHQTQQHSRRCAHQQVKGMKAGKRVLKYQPQLCKCCQ